MTRSLLASVRLWAGRTSEAVELAAEALAGFEELDDAYGLGQATSVLGRAMVMSGDVDGGLRILRRGSEGGGAQLVRLAMFATGLQLGQPELGAESTGELAAMWAGGSPEATMALGMFALQTGDLDGAEHHLFGGGSSPAGANLRAGRALVGALTGRDDVGSLISGVVAADGATYLDRYLIAMARAVVASGDQDPSARGEACAALRAAMDEVESTGDVLARATFGLVTSRLGEDLGCAVGNGVEDAERALAALGIAATGWRTVLDLARARQGSGRSRTPG